MNEIDFTIRCTDDICRDSPARYKVAAEWTGGGYTELKTYGFADDHCLDRVYRMAFERAKAIRFSEGESLGEMRVYFLDAHRHDYELARAIDVERQVRHRLKLFLD